MKVTVKEIDRILNETKPIFAAFNPVWAKAQRKLKGES